MWFEFSSEAGEGTWFILFRHEIRNSAAADFRSPVIQLSCHRWTLRHRSSHHGEIHRFRSCLKEYSGCLARRGSRRQYVVNQQEPPSLITVSRPNRKCASNISLSLIERQGSLLLCTTTAFQCPFHRKAQACSHLNRQWHTAIVTAQ